MDFDTLFQQATHQSPYPYQRRLALAEDLPEALSAPTGAGKTAAVVHAWLYRRRFAAQATRDATPRRLVFCLPMRTLVSQTALATRGWLDRLGLLDAGHGLDRGDRVGVHTLMGGAVDDDWHLHPERDAVLVGTQDMLLSRALNRGYASSRFRWPWEYALVSNDSLWVFDEVQLMGAGLATGLQLAALRAKLGTFGPTHTLFMSATLEPAWLETVDHPAPRDVFALEADDLAAPDLTKRRCATKRLERSSVKLGDKTSAPALAAEVLARHVAGTRTLVVVNRVETAVNLHTELKKLGAKKDVVSVLLHSRFRPPERERAVARATAKDFTGVVVATQVVEAGVDMTSRTLFTEIAPWPSVVQRAGRCNRGGEENDAVVYWVDHPADDKAREKAAAPYALEDLALARAHLLEMTTFNPEAIAARGVKVAAEPAAHVIRRRDVVDLFDTTPDLAGADLDVSRFIREGDERDAQVFWRDLPPGEKPDAKAPRPHRDELCAVPVYKLREWLAKRDAWRWNAIDGVWEKVRGDRVFPGMTLMLRAADGGYDPERGWDESQTERPVTVIDARAKEDAEPEESLGDDPLSDLGRLDVREAKPNEASPRWVDLATHSTDARDAAREITTALAPHILPEDLAAVLVRAAHAHDLGKAHAVFQETMGKGYPGEATGPWAKSGSKAGHARRGFRHELASALAWLAQGDAHERDLVAYLLAAHHGKVRLSIRAMPQDAAPDDPEVLHARGVFEGDELPQTDLGGGLTVPATVLSLAPMRVGRSPAGPSWMERAASLRERFGPFKLAYLEALVRAADVRASMREARGMR